MANTGKTVIVAALDGTFQRKVKHFSFSTVVALETSPNPASSTASVLVQAFGSILNLVPLAESVVKLNAVCMECYREASYTKRLGAEREVSSLGAQSISAASPCQLC